METIVAQSKEHLKELIQKAIKEQGPNADLNFIDVSEITDMSHMFEYSEFCGDISKWNVASVTNMSYMFARNQSFNGDISNWDTANVTDMSSMFVSNRAFNGDISNWNTANVTDMSYMFNCSVFNGDISNWNTASVTNMSYMFYKSKFNGDITSWNVANVTNMSYMFFESQFNGDIFKWDFTNVTYITHFINKNFVHKTKAPIVSGNTLTVAIKMFCDDIPILPELYDIIKGYNKLSVNYEKHLQKVIPFYESDPDEIPDTLSQWLNTIRSNNTLTLDEAEIGSIEVMAEYQQDYERFVQSLGRLKRREAPWKYFEERLLPSLELDPPFYYEQVQNRIIDISQNRITSGYQNRFTDNSEDKKICLALVQRYLGYLIIGE